MDFYEYFNQGPKEVLMRIFKILKTLKRVSMDFKNIFIKDLRKYTRGFLRTFCKELKKY